VFIIFSSYSEGKQHLFLSGAYVLSSEISQVMLTKEEEGVENHDMCSYCVNDKNDVCNLKLFEIKYKKHVSDNYS
jgi:hypothetical protein